MADAGPGPIQFHEGVFEKITNVQWGGNATRLIVDNTSPNITQTVTGVADSQFFSMSVFFRVADPTVPDGYGFNILDISPVTGEPGGPATFSGCQVGASIGLGVGLGSEGIIGVGMGPGPNAVFNMHDYITYVNDLDPTDAYAALDTNDWRQNITSLLFIPRGTFRRRGWNHLLVAFDTDADTTAGEGIDNTSAFPLLTGPRVNAVLNRVPLLSAQDGPNKYRSFSMTSALALSPSYPVEQFAMQTTFPDVFTRKTIPGFKIGYAGNSLGVPITQADNFSGSSPFSKLDLARMQIWTNQFVAADSQNLFIDWSSGVGLPVPLKVAAAALGKPQFLFDGAPASFVKNDGTSKAPSVVTGRDQMKSTDSPRVA